jgi:hypothetical protein|tara:strand:+ start:2514 stop:3248 length:735 start_codon:yes stop_codon:yes gene_type:complete
MPRNYKKEYENYHSRPDEKKRRAARNAARKMLKGRKELTDEKDVHHKDNDPLNNDKSNLAIVSQRYNRREPRLRKEMKTFGDHCECGQESGLVESNLYRVGSEAYYKYWRDIREEWKQGNVMIEPHEVEIMEGDLGKFARFNENNVALDCIFEEEEPELNKPKKGGSKKYYVYVKGSDGKVKKISWGDTTGLKVKLNDPAARKSFAARHKCETKTDKMTAGYWACRLPRYAKQLGLSGGGNFFW